MKITALKTYIMVKVETDEGLYGWGEGTLEMKQGTVAAAVRDPEVILLDSDMATVGSVNFDNRSFAINFEITLWFTDPSTIAAVEAMLLKDFEACRQVGLSEVETRPWPIYLATQAARLLSPVL